MTVTAVLLMVSLAACTTSSPHTAHLGYSHPANNAAMNSTGGCLWRRADAVRVGVSFSRSDVYEVYSQPDRVVADMFAAHINSEQQCGFGGLGIPLEVQWQEILSDDAQGVATATRALLQTNLSLLMLPEGALATFAAAEAATAGLALIAGSSGVGNLFFADDSTPPQRQFENVVATLTPIEGYFATLLPLLRIQGYLRVAVVSSGTELDASTCNASVSSVADNNMQLLLHTTLPISNNSMVSAGDLRAALLQAKQLDADVLLSCFSLQCDTLYLQLRELDFNPHAHGAFECGNTITNYGPEATALAQYSFSPVQFDCRLFGQLYADALDPMFPYVGYGETASLLPPPLRSHAILLGVHGCGQRSAHKLGDGLAVGRLVCGQRCGGAG